MNHVRRLVILALLAGGALLGPGSAAARLANAAPHERNPRRPAPGMLLVASAHLPDPNFSRTVVLLLDYGAKGALGLVINRPLAASLGDVLPGVPELAGHRVDVYMGGPVQPDHVAVLFRLAADVRNARRVVGDVQVTFSRSTLLALLRRPGAVPVMRAYAGYAGWGAGQLDAEVAHGDWHLLPASAALVFSEDTAGLWRRLNRKAAGFWVHRGPALLAPVPAAGVSLVRMYEHVHGLGASAVLPLPGRRVSGVIPGDQFRAEAVAAAVFTGRRACRIIRACEAAVPGR